MNRTWLLLILLLSFGVAMGLATGCGDDDEDVDAGTDTDTDTDTDCDAQDAGMDAGPEWCATVTGTISIGPGFAGPASALAIALYEEEPNAAAPVMPDVSASVEAPNINSDTPYALDTEICGITPDTEYYTAIVVFNGVPSLPVPGDAQGSKDTPDVYEACGTVDLGALELEVKQ